MHEPKKKVSKCSAVAEIGDRLATIDMGRKLGVVPLFGRGSWVIIQHKIARAEAYLRAKFHLDPSNRLATVHERHKKDYERVFIRCGESFVMNVTL